MSVGAGDPARATSESLVYTRRTGEDARAYIFFLRTYTSGRIRSHGCQSPCW